MAIYQKDIDAVKNALWGEEKVMVTATQRKNPVLGGSVINPTTIVATDKRVIIVNREVAGIRKDIESIPYNRIASVRLEKGILTSTVYLRVGGFAGGDEQGFMKSGEDQGEIPGLKNADAKALADLVNQMIVGADSGMPTGNFNQQQNQSRQSQPKMQNKAPVNPTPGASIYCPKCGMENDVTAKFCTSCGAKLGK